MRLAQLAGLAVLAIMPVWAWACWEDAAQRYGVPANLLYAMARVESNLNRKAVNRSHIQRTGSYDIGLMQINSKRSTAPPCQAPSYAMAGALIGSNSSIRL